MNISFPRLLVCTAIIASLAGAMFWFVGCRTSGTAREDVSVLFFSASSSTPLQLSSAESEVIRELTAKLKSGEDGVVKHKVFALASIGYFLVAEERFEWYGDVLYYWSDSEGGYRVLADSRLKNCFDVLRTKHEPFVPSEVTASDWSEALGCLSNKL